jgi:hypothetical protein
LTVKRPGSSNLQRYSAQLQIAQRPAVLRFHVYWLAGDAPVARGSLSAEQTSSSLYTSTDSEAEASLDERALTAILLPDMEQVYQHTGDAFFTGGLKVTWPADAATDTPGAVTSIDPTAEPRASLPQRWAALQAEGERE